MSTHMSLQLFRQGDVVVHPTRGEARIVMTTNNLRAPGIGHNYIGHNYIGHNFEDKQPPRARHGLLQTDRRHFGRTHMRTAAQIHACAHACVSGCTHIHTQARTSVRQHMCVLTHGHIQGSQPPPRMQAGRMWCNSSTERHTGMHLSVHMPVHMSRHMSMSVRISCHDLDETPIGISVYTLRVREHGAHTKS